MQQGKKPSNQDLATFTKVWQELTVVDGLLLRGKPIVVPDGNLGEDCGTLHQWCVELAHKGHQGTAGTKQLLRTRLLWPGMDRFLEARGKFCLVCQAATMSHHRDPLQPTTAPARPMEQQSRDHRGPTPDSNFILVTMDLLKRFPEVTLVKGTSADANINSAPSCPTSEATGQTPSRTSGKPEQRTPTRKPSR